MNARFHLLTAGIFLAAATAGLGQQPVITQQPRACTNCVGSTATLWVEATGTEPLAYQWQKLSVNWSDLPGRTATNLVLANVQTSHGGDYRVVITNVSGAVTSDVARLTVGVPPTIAAGGQPMSFPSVSLGASVGNQVVASGTAPLTYLWRLFGVPVAGQAQAALVLSNLALSAAGDYTVVVTNLFGAVTSQVARLEIDPTFTKITAGQLVTDTIVSSWRPPCWADYDGDGYLDVLAPAYDWYFIPVYRNNGDGTFTRLLLPSLQGHTNCIGFNATWGDYDNDGYPDLLTPDFGAFYGRSGKNLVLHNDGNGALTPNTANPIVQDGGTCFMGAWGDFNRDGFLDLAVACGSYYAQARNLLYMGGGDGTFSRLSGVITSELGNFETLAWVDADEDGWPDLFVTEHSYNRLYRNLRNGSFSKVTGTPLVTEAGHSWFSSTWGDYDNDGDLDPFITEMGASTFDLLPVALYRNERACQFTKLTTSHVGPLAAELLYGWSCAWGDYDNDGWLDLFVASGVYEINGRRCVLFHNNGDGTFTKIMTGSPVNEGGGTPWVQWVDYDQDGRLDLFVSPRDGSAPHRLYRNNGNANNWLCVKCEGTASPRLGTGAKVRVKATIGGLPMWQLRLIDAGGSGSSFVAHFGLGDATVVDTLRIEWTSGIVQEFNNVPAGRYVTVTEPAKLAMTQPGVLNIQCWRGMTYQVEGSPDLRTWTPLDTVTNPNLTGGIRWTDPTAPSQTARFYRAVRQ